MAGIKYDQGKLRYDLLPWSAVAEVVKVLGYGAAKYSAKLEIVDFYKELADNCSCNAKTESQQLAILIADMQQKACALNATTLNIQLQNEQPVMLTDLSMPKDSANPAMISNSKNLIQNSLPHNRPTTNNGEQNTLSTSMLMVKNGEQPTQIESQNVTENNDLLSSILPGKTKLECLLNKLEDVPSVGLQIQSEPLTSTMITQQVRLEAYSAVNAIKVSDYSTIVQIALQRHLNTCPNQSVKYLTSATSLIRSGENNWRNLTTPHQRYFAASIRHLTAWYGGEENDDESGLSHLAHAMCCILFMMSIPR